MGEVVYNQVRTGEKPRTWYRTERIFRNERGWYFNTREGIEVGPFSCRFDAEVDLEQMVARLKGTEGEAAERTVHAQAVTAASGDYMLNSEIYTNYLIEEGGAELLHGAAVA